MVLTHEVLKAVPIFFNATIKLLNIYVWLILQDGFVKIAINDSIFKHFYFIRVCGTVLYKVKSQNVATLLIN